MRMFSVRKGKNKKGGFSKNVVILSLFAFLVILFLGWALVSRTSGEIATLYFSPSSLNVFAGDNFTLDVFVDTKENDIVAVKSIIDYNPLEFELVGWDTSSSVFSSNNTCIYDDKPCEIISNSPDNGSIMITLAKPTPGVNTASGLIANLSFKALKANKDPMENIKLRYVTFGNYDDSDVILDDGSGTDILSSVINTTINLILPQPENVAASGATATSIDLTWSPKNQNIGVTGYKIFRDGSQVGTTANLTFTDTGLTPLTSYSYRVSAYDAEGNESAQSASISFSTLADTTAPTIPTGLYSGATLMDATGLYWDASSDDVGVVGYKVYRDGNLIGTTPTTSYGDIGLTPNTSYNYAVSAYDAAGNESDQTDPLTVKTLPDSQAPSVPGNLVATAVSISQINLSWSASTDNVEVVGYKVFRNGSQVGTTETTSYEDMNLQVSTSYTYAVSAYDEEGNESEKSSQTSATTNSDTEGPSAPQNVSAQAVSMSAINITWNASTDNVGVSGYRVLRNGEQIGTTSATNYEDSGLEHNTSYSYTVVAFDAAGNQSVPSSSVQATTLDDTQAPTVPADLTGQAVSMTVISLSWSPSSDNIGVAGYRVYRNGLMVGETAETSFEDTGLSEGTQYAYTVSAFDAKGNISAQSNSVNIRTLERKFSLADFVALVESWLSTGVDLESDVNNDGIVNARDIGIMMSNWEN